MSQRWAVWFDVSGDVRFLSHHDLVRVMERAAARAKLPVRHSQGFNPRPRLSLVLPRPVGVASRCEVMVIDFDADLPVAQPFQAVRAQAGKPVPPGTAGETPATLPDWAAALGRQLPPGLAVGRAHPLPPGRQPQSEQVTYAMELDSDEAAAVAARLKELDRQPSWPVRRQRHGAPPEAARDIDLRPLVRALDLAGTTLTFTLATGPSGSARCGEVLSLLPLSGAAAGPAGGAEAASPGVARLTRTLLTLTSAAGDKESTE